MLITVNGQKMECREECSLKELLLHMPPPSGRSAVIVNGVAVQENDRPDFTLRDGDSVEILVLAGGG